MLCITETQRLHRHCLSSSEIQEQVAELFSGDWMGSMLGDWPSFDPTNFSQLRPSDRSSPSRMTPVIYCPTHDRCLPPPNQVITSESRNILLKNMYKHTEEKLRSKRPASEILTTDQRSKFARTSTAESPF